MTQNNPKHTKGFDTIKHIEYIMFMFENFEGLSEIESIKQFHSC